MQKREHVHGILLTGLEGTGKDATGKRLPAALASMGLPWKCFSVGTQITRPIAAAHPGGGMSIEEYTKRCDEDPAFNPTFDIDVDTKVLKYCDENKHFVLTSRTIPALLVERPDIYPVKNPERIVKIRFDCEHVERITRVVKREFEKKNSRQPTDAEIEEWFPHWEKETVARAERDRVRYQRVYGIKNIFDDDYFDYLVNTTGKTLEDQIGHTCNVVMAFIL
jgi:cytidylate kinase